MNSSLRLKRFLTFNFISVALLPIIVFGLITLNILTENMENEIRWKNMLLARHLSSQVERFLGEPLSLLRQIGDVVISRELIKTPELNEYIESVMGNYGLFDTILLLDKEAVVKHRAPYNRSYIGISMLGNRYVKKAMETGNPVWSSTFMSIDTGEPTIHLIYPRRDKTAVMGYLNLGTLSNLMTGLELGREGKVFLLDRNGVVIAHKDESWVTHRKNLRNFEMVKQGLAGVESTFRRRMFGANYLGSVAIVPHTRWLVMVVQPEEEALVPVRRIKVLFWGGSVVALFLALFVALGSIGRTLRPLNHLLSQTRKIAQGDYTFQNQPGSFQEIDALAQGFKYMAEAVRSREAELLASEAKYRELVENANSIILRLNPEGRITFFNEFAQVFFNLSEQEILGRHIVGTIVPPDESSGRDLESFIQDLLGQPEGHPSSENENIRPNGERVWVSWNNKPVYDDDGRLVEILCVGIDITARKMAEDRLREALDRLDATMNALPDLFFETDRSGKIYDFRAPKPESFYPTPEHFIGRSIEAVLPSPAAGILMDAIHKALDWGIYDGVVYSLELEGEVRWFETSIARKGERQNPDCRLIALARDITEREKAEQAIREGEQKLKAIFEASPDPMVVYDKDGILQYLNPAFTRVFGWTLEELYGRIVPYIPKDQEDISTVKIKELYETEGPVRLETRRLNKKGEQLDIIISAAPISDFDGRTIGMVVNLTDITARKKLEFQLQQAHKMEAIGTLAGGIAHDFNNLLQAISGYAQIILLRRKEEDQGVRELNEILSLCDRAAQLIQQLLTFSRKVESKKRPIDANLEVCQVKELFERTLPRMIDIELHLADNLMTINADPVQVEQILMNLGSNARDAMPEGGRLIIETANVYLDDEYCKYHRGAIPGDYVLVSVTDTGQGMDKDTLEHIFEPFFTTKELGKGTGLGLASVYGIVKNHGGYITCQSELGRGTVFSIYLPAGRHYELTPETVKTLDPVKGGDETILVVDDDAWIRDTATEVLRYYGYRVLLASNGEKAVDIYKSNTIDLVILDLSMPGMGGYKCMKALVAYDPAVKVLIASGYSTDTHVKDTVELGAAGFLAKPFQLNDILANVRQVLDQ